VVSRPPEANQTQGNWACITSTALGFSADCCHPTIKMQNHSQTPAPQHSLSKWQDQTSTSSSTHDQNLGDYKSMNDQLRSALIVDLEKVNDA